MGLTWIDHDTIEKPIEQITLGTEDADDIEFTVETLKSKAESDRKANMHKKVVNENIIHTYIFIIQINLLKESLKYLRSSASPELY